MHFFTEFKGLRSQTRKQIRDLVRKSWKQFRGFGSLCSKKRPLICARMEGRQCGGARGSGQGNRKVLTNSIVYY